MEEIYVSSERTNVKSSHMHLHVNQAGILGTMNVGNYAPAQTENR